MSNDAAKAAAKRANKGLMGADEEPVAIVAKPAQPKYAPSVAAPKAAVSIAAVTEESKAEATGKAKEKKYPFTSTITASNKRRLENYQRNTLGGIKTTDVFNIAMKKFFDDNSHVADVALDDLR